MKKLSGLFLGDRVIWIVFFALCIISVVEVFSALSTLTYQSGSYVLPIARHAAFLITGFVVVQIVHRLPCRYFRAMLPFAVLASVLLLVLEPLPQLVHRDVKEAVNVSVCEFFHSAGI